MNASIIYVDREWIAQSKRVYIEKFHLLHSSIKLELLMNESFINSRYYYIPITPSLKTAFKTVNPTTSDIPTHNMGAFLKSAIFFSEATIDELMASPYWPLLFNYNFNTYYNNSEDEFEYMNVFFAYASFRLIKETLLLKPFITQLNPKDINILHRRKDIDLDMICFSSKYAINQCVNEMSVIVNDKYYISSSVYDTLKKNSRKEIFKVQFNIEFKELDNLLAHFENIAPNSLTDYELDKLSYYYYLKKNTPALKKYIFCNHILNWDWNCLTTSLQTTFQFIIENPQYPWNYEILLQNNNITENDIDTHPEIHWFMNTHYLMNPNIGWNKLKFNIYNNYDGFRETYAKKITQHYITKMMKFII